TMTEDHGLGDGVSAGEGTALVRGGDEAEASAAKAALQRIALWSVLTGLCPMIPIPFVDDMALRFIRKRALRAELDRGGIRPGRAQLDVYLAQPTNLMGCVTAMVIYPLKKIFRKVFIFLAIKDCVDAASRTFHELWMIRHGVVSGQLTAADVTVEVDALIPLRRAVEATSRQVDTRPVNQVLRRGFVGSKAWLREGGRALGKVIRRGGGSRSDPEAVQRAVDAVEASQVGDVNELAGRLGEQMWAERGYLSLVEQTFDQHWKRRNESGL
ncbi:MAG: hypothetical protein U1E22_07485, partial [Coriobacteriia bacterium]|nr:hypothetical protein [Coriobacteriia bacterium]